MTVEHRHHLFIYTRVPTVRRASQPCSCSLVRHDRIHHPHESTHTVDLVHLCETVARERARRLYTRQVEHSTLLNLSSANSIAVLAFHTGVPADKRLPLDGRRVVRHGDGEERARRDRQRAGAAGEHGGETETDGKSNGTDREE